MKKQKTKRLTLNIKIFPDEAKAFRAKAERLTKGNFTKLCRFAISSFKPRKKDLERLKSKSRI